VSITLTPKPKIPVRTPVSAHVEGPARIPAVASDPVRPAGPPALLLDHVSKTFVMGRKKKAVAAISDVSLRVERAEIYGSWAPMGAASQRSSGSCPRS